VLEDLGLGVEEDRLDLKIVSEKLNDEIWHVVELMSYASAQAAIATLYNEVLIVKNDMDNVVEERDKFRSDIREAQKRAEILALEIDEQHCRRENQKKEELQELNQLWYIKLKSIEDELEQEKESHEATILGLQRTFDEDKKNFEEMLRNMEREVCSLNERNDSLENEIDSSKKKIKEIKVANKLLQKGMENTNDVDEHIKDEDTSPDLIRNVEELVKLNKDLKDRNEVLEMDFIVNSFNACSNPHLENLMKRKGSHLQESPPYCKTKLIKKNTDEEVKAFICDESESENEEDEIISLSDIWCSFDQQFKVPSIADPCKTMEDEIKNIHLNDSNDELAQKYSKQIIKLEEQNQELQKTIKNMSSYVKKECETESNMLLETNKHLEESLDLMRSEFESMEDYWQKKLDDERMFYEEQLKISEKQFQELEARMKEYEELLASNENSRVDQLHDLYPIDEQQDMEERVNEWEEEISQLKSKLNDLRTDHEKELVALKEEMDKIINYNPYKSVSCIRCADFASLREKRKNLELSWLKVVQYDNKQSLQDSSVSHLSLPSYLSEDQGQDCRMRQDLRQCIQEDYDNMLLRKERMKMSLEENKKNTSNMSTQAPTIVNIQESSTNTPTTAYKAILSDISYQVSLLQTELSTPTSLDKTITQTMRDRMSDQANRCTNLHSTLAIKRAKYSKDMAVTKDQQESELSQLESLVSSSQELMRRQTKAYMEKMNTLVMIDRDIEQMMAENQNLSSKIKIMKKKL